MASLLGLGEYDSPAPHEGQGTPPDPSQHVPEAENGADTAIRLSIVDYDHDADEKGGEEGASSSSLLGITLDDDAVQKAAPRRVGVGGVQISVVKKPAATASSAGPQEASDDAVEAGGTEVGAGAAPSTAFVIPPEPPAEVDPKLLEKFLGRPPRALPRRPARAPTPRASAAGLVEKTKEGYSVNEHIRNAKSFRNPDILEKLVAFFDVRECGTNYTAELYNPAELGKDEHYDKLEEARRRWEERQARKQGERVQFTSAGATDGAPAAARAAAPLAAAAPADAGAPKRKSKWGADAAATAEPAAKRPQAP